MTCSLKENTNNEFLNTILFIIFIQYLMASAEDSLNKLITTYLHSAKNKDIVVLQDDERILRGNIKPITTHKEIFKTIGKKNVDYAKTINLSNPFESEQFKNYIKTDAQNLMEKIANKLPYSGTYALSCSCGSGKTLAGIYAIHKLQKQSLIISYRSAINTQWKNTIEKAYKNETVIIKTKDGIFKNGVKNNKLKDDDVDIFIYSPQYLLHNPNKFPITVGLIIYDEIHSILSDEYSCAMKLPIYNCIKKIIPELPYMIGLSATFPSKTDKSYNIIYKLFGNPVYAKSKITDIPIYVCDNRDIIKGGLKKDDIYDTNYKIHQLQPTDYIKSILNNENKVFNKYIEPTIIKYDKQYCGFVITEQINESIYAWIQFYKKYNKRCVLIREENDGYYILKNNIPDEIIKLETTINFQYIKNHKSFNDFCEKIDSLEGNDILFGTYSRLKEGISVQTAVWGICAKFIWSVQSRIQILGRIRRLSNNTELNNYPRYFIVNSGVVPSNIYSHRKHKYIPLKLLYDFNDEKERYKNENYIVITIDEYNKL